MDQKSAAVIYRMFYSILHLVFTIYESVESMYRSLKIKLLELRHEFKINKTEKLVKIEKIPRHLTVLLGTEEPSPKDLANLILWCLAARITFVSFYDHKGELKKKEEKLRLLVEGMKIASDHVIWHSDPDSAPKNGYTGRKIHVKVLSRDDGRGGVVNVIKTLASSSDINFNLDSFDKGLKKQFEFPDPDLGVCCGKTFSLLGYPPWQIRVTEFLTISSHRNITFDMFVKLLHRYSKCEQRYGK